VLFVGAGTAGQNDWKSWQLWWFGQSFGVRDPQFGRDISFFAWDYPAYRLVLGFAFDAVLLSLLFSLAVHYLFGALRIATPGPKLTVSARRQVTVLIFVFTILKACAYWLDRYGLVFSARGIVTGASFTDVHATLPAKTILFWIAVLIAIAVLASLWFRSTRLAGISFGVLLALSIAISGIYPAVVQQFTVKPNASDREAPYIARNIAATRRAYGVASSTAVGPVTYTDYATGPVRDPAQLATDTATVPNIRILDPNVVSPTFTTQQQLKNVYGFASQLDIDRYLVNGQTSTYIVGVRELKAANLSGSQANWINQHTVYTHGYGFVAAKANQSVNTKADFAEGGIPPTGFLQIDKPQVYYGQLMVDYSVVGATGTRENDGSDHKTSYAGAGGISLGSVAHRLAFAVRYRELNFLLNDAVAAKGAKIIFNRDPRQRVLSVAPFLQVDRNPYPAVVDGRIVWILDGYTTLANYPYSEKESLASVTTDSVSGSNQASQPNSDINYIRNSVKATVDAYDGTVKLYAWDESDPVLRTWRKVFPGGGARQGRDAGRRTGSRPVPAGRLRGTASGAGAVPRQRPGAVLQRAEQVDRARRPDRGGARRGPVAVLPVGLSGRHRTDSIPADVTNEGEQPTEYGGVHLGGFGGRAELRQIRGAHAADRLDDPGPRADFQPFQLRAGDLQGHHPAQHRRIDRGARQPAVVADRLHIPLRRTALRAGLRNKHLPPAAPGLGGLRRQDRLRRNAAFCIAELDPVGGGPGDQQHRQHNADLHTAADARSLGRSPGPHSDRHATRRCDRATPRCVPEGGPARDRAGAGRHQAPIGPLPQGPTRCHRLGLTEANDIALTDAAGLRHPEIRDAGECYAIRQRPAKPLSARFAV
jgi:hypothetical protein